MHTQIYAWLQTINLNYYYCVSLQGNLLKLSQHCTMTSYPHHLSSPLAHLATNCNILKIWMRDLKGANEQQIALVVVFLPNNYLRSILLPVGAFLAHGLNKCRH